MAKTEVWTIGGEVSSVVVTLSRRNLLALLHKVDQPWSAKALQNNDTYVGGESRPDVLLTLIVEDDDEHYGKRTEKYGAASGPGEMHPETEAFIATER